MDFPWISNGFPMVETEIRQDDDQWEVSTIPRPLAGRLRGPKQWWPGELQQIVTLGYYAYDIYVNNVVYIYNIRIT